MLHSLKTICGFAVEAVDGTVGQVSEFCFDDRTWLIRYLVAETGHWLERREVLLTTSVLSAPLLDRRVLPISLNRQAVEDYPDMDEDPPIYKQREREWHTYTLGLPEGSLAGGLMPSPMIMQLIEAEEQRDQHRQRNLHLRSTREVTGYHIKALDGEVGHVEDFLVDDGPWRIAYLVIDTRNWLPGRKVLIAPEHITAVKWVDRLVYVGLDRAAIENGPEFDEKSIRRDDAS
jgi:hypothetical protein